MTARFFKASLLFITLTGLVGCGASTEPTTPTRGAIVGGVGGSAIGAGTGAIIGSIISNGDIAASAALGAGIGLPVGIAAGALYAVSVRESELDRNADRIEENREQIIRRQEEIDSVRESTIADSFDLHPDQDLEEYMYDGQIHGNHFR